MTTPGSRASRFRCQGKGCLRPLTEATAHVGTNGKVDCWKCYDRLPRSSVEQ
jgi:hypothetical protein